MSDIDETLDGMDLDNLKDEDIHELLAQLMGESVEEIRKNMPDDYDKEILRALVYNYGKYQLVAEVVTARFCGAGLQVGDKYVVKEFAIDPEETTAPLCLGPMQELMTRSYAFFDRTRRRFKPEDITRPITGMRCFDPGWKLGGGGHVEFKVRIEKIGD